jgi:hypothetical protein
MDLGGVERRGRNPGVMSEKYGKKEEEQNLLTPCPPSILVRTLIKSFT